MNLARSFVRLMFQAMWADVGVSSRKAAPGGVEKPACAGIILAERGVKQLLQPGDNWHNNLQDCMESVESEESEGATPVEWKLWHSVLKL